MTNKEQNEDKPAAKKSKAPLFIGLILGVIGAGGGFFAAQSGMLPGGESHADAAQDGHGDHDDHGSIDTHDEPLLITDMADVAFVPVDPLVVSLGPDYQSHLRFRAQLEVVPPYKSEIERLMPRVVDVLNGYLRALEPGVLEDSAGLTRLRAQMLRRIQIVTGAGRVNDLLIMEFVLN